MKIQLSPIRIVPDVLTVWSEHGPEVDIVMDLKKLTFKPGSVDELYSFHVLDHLFPDEIVPAITNWRSCLKDKGKAFFLVDDFEYITRAFVGGDIDINLINDLHNHPTQLTKENLVTFLKAGGFNETVINQWFANVPHLFEKKHYELLLDATKHE